MTNQRLRNLTTGRLHTEMDHIYKDIEFLTGESGMMTHHIPNAMRALEPWLRQQVQDPNFWEDVYDTTDTGKTEIQPMNEQDRGDFFARFAAQPSPFALP